MKKIIKEHEHFEKFMGYKAPEFKSDSREFHVILWNLNYISNNKNEYAIGRLCLYLFINKSDDFIHEKLPVNEELTLREITAPDGYEIAEDVTFTLKDTMEVQKVEMKDARTPEKTTEKTNAPKTGDNQKVWPFVLLALASAGTATGVTVYRRKKSKMTDNKEETEEK
jgi:LPXTG-motif cell wall-anchored protein